MSGRHAASGRWRLGLALAVATTALWGSLPIALKSLLGTVDVVTLTWYRYVSSAIFLGLFLILRGGLPRFPRRREVFLLLAVAAIGFLGNNLLYLAGLGRMSPSAAQVLIQSAPVLLIAGGVVIFKEHFTRLQWAGLVGLPLGIVLFFHRKLTAFSSGDQTALGAALILISAVLWAAFALAQKQLLKHYSSGAIVWVLYTAGAVALAPVAKFGAATQLDRGGALFLVYACVNGFVAYACFAEAMAHWEASRVSAVVAVAPLLTPAFTALAAMLWPGRIAPEGLTAVQILAAVLVVACSALVALAKPK